MALYFQGMREMRRGECVFQQSQLPHQPLLSRPGLHASGSGKADLRGEKALWPAYAEGQGLPCFRSHPELSRPLPPSAGLRWAAGWGLCVLLSQKLGVTKMGPQEPRRGWHLLGGTAPGSGRPARFEAPERPQMQAGMPHRNEPGWNSRDQKWLCSGRSSQNS